MLETSFESPLQRANADICGVFASELEARKIDLENNCLSSLSSLTGLMSSLYDFVSKHDAVESELTEQSELQKTLIESLETNNEVLSKLTASIMSLGSFDAAAIHTSLIRRTLAISIIDRTKSETSSLLESSNSLKNDLQHIFESSKDFQCATDLKRSEGGVAFSGESAESSNLPTTFLKSLKDKSIDFGNDAIHHVALKNMMDFYEKYSESVKSFKDKVAQSFSALLIDGGNDRDVSLTSVLRTVNDVITEILNKSDLRISEEVITLQHKLDEYETLINAAKNGLTDFPTNILSNEKLQDILVSLNSLPFPYSDFLKNFKN